MADYYSDNADALYAQYQSLAFDEVHADWLTHLPDRPGFALDVGAGSGRDAAALAARGWEVVATEPADALRALAAEGTAGSTVQWLDDRLPDLAKTRAAGFRFDLILVSAVWMHVPASQSERAFRILTELLAPGGQLVITLRHGPSPDERTFREIDAGEIEALARRRALLTAHRAQSADQRGREGVWWDTLVFRLPDDGTGALPLLRHVIVNDAKASTYKLGLLRAVTRIADGVPGMVIRRTDDHVEIPFGLVGLYWLKLYQPLVLRHELRQVQGRANYAFAREAFNALRALSPLDLRVGQRLNAEWARTVLHAIRDACDTIAEMPAHYTTYPGTGTPIFQTEPPAANRRFRAQPAMLDRDTLLRFGRFRIPAHVWDCCSRYACWLEPAIVHEWAALMQSYEARYSSDVIFSALRWEDERRDTHAVRELIEQRLQSSDVRCVWTNRSLRRARYDVDHCFPWSRWPNNDLWNLLPATAQANSDKREKLPSADMLDQSRERIMNWWESELVGTDRETHFFAEAEAALPMPTADHRLETIFEGVTQQRMRLKMNQQLAEWHGLD